jgi:hypothetical protein
LLTRHSVSHLHSVRSLAVHSCVVSVFQSKMHPNHLYQHQLCLQNDVHYCDHQFYLRTASILFAKSTSNCTRRETGVHSTIITNRHPNPAFRNLYPSQLRTAPAPTRRSTVIMVAMLLALLSAIRDHPNIRMTISKSINYVNLCIFYPFQCTRCVARLITVG